MPAPAVTSASLTSKVPTNSFYIVPLYNTTESHTDERGTLIGNWVEEGEMKHLTGHTRHGELSIESFLPSLTHDRCVIHTIPGKTLEESKALDANNFQTTYKNEYVNHIPESKDKRYHIAKWDENTRSKRHSLCMESRDRHIHDRSYVTQYQATHLVPVAVDPTYSRIYDGKANNGNLRHSTIEQADATRLCVNKLNATKLL